MRIVFFNTGDLIIRLLLNDDQHRFPGNYIRYRYFVSLMLQQIMALLTMSPADFGLGLPSH